MTWLKWLIFQNYDVIDLVICTHSNLDMGSDKFRDISGPFSFCVCLKLQLPG